MPRPGPPSSAPTGQSPSWSGWVILILLLGAMWAWQLFGAANKEQPSIDYSQFFSLLENGSVASVTNLGSTVTGRFKEDQNTGERQTREFRTSFRPRWTMSFFLFFQKQVVRSAEKRGPTVGSAAHLQLAALGAHHRRLVLALATIQKMARGPTR